MLERFLIAQVFAFLLIFCRTGSAIMLLPGFAELYVSARVRLFLAATFSLVLVPITPDLPAVPSTIPELATLIIAEIIIGLFLGGLSRIIIGAVHVAGTIIAYQSSLASAVVQDLTHEQTQGTALCNMLGVCALVLLFVTDLHILILRGLADSYTLFHAGDFPLVSDFAKHSIQTMAGSFQMAMKMAAPHLVVGMLLYLGAGIISRLMPNIQIFFLIMAPQLLISFFILLISISAIMLWYMDYFKESLAAFLG